LFDIISLRIHLYFTCSFFIRIIGMKFLGAKLLRYFRGWRYQNVGIRGAAAVCTSPFWSFTQSIWTTAYLHSSLYKCK